MTLFALVAYTGLALAMEASLDQMLQLNVGPVSVYLWDLLLMASVALLLRETFVPDGLRMPSRNRTVVILVFGYCAYQIAVIFPVSVIFYERDSVGVIRDLGWRFGLILIPFVYLVALKYVSLRRLLLGLNLAAVLLAMYAVYRYGTGQGAAHANDVGVFRLRELWGGASLLFGLLILCSLFLLRPSLLSYAGAILGLISLALVNHRSGYLALLVVMIPLFVHFRRASARVTVVGLVAISAAAMLVAASPAIRTSTYYSLDTMLKPNADINSRDRIARSKLGWDYFVAHPLGDYAWSHQWFLVDLGPDNGFEPHNFVIQLLSKQGIVGFAFFAAIIVTTVRIGWRNRNADPMSAVMLAYFVFYLVFNLFNTNFINQWNVLLLAVPVGAILSRNAGLQGVTEQQPVTAIAPNGESGAGRVPTR